MYHSTRAKNKELLYSLSHQRTKFEEAWTEYLKARELYDEQLKNEPDQSKTGIEAA
jgi:hypothetical protein